MQRLIIGLVIAAETDNPVSKNNIGQNGSAQAILQYTISW